MRLLGCYYYHLETPRRLTAHHPYSAKEPVDKPLAVHWGDRGEELQEGGAVLDSSAWNIVRVLLLLLLLLREKGELDISFKPSKRYWSGIRNFILAQAVTTPGSGNACPEKIKIQVVSIDSAQISATQLDIYLGLIILECQDGGGWRAGGRRPWFGKALGVVRACPGMGARLRGMECMVSMHADGLLFDSLDSLPCIVYRIFEHYSRNEKGKYE